MKRFTCRGTPGKRGAIVTLAAMIVSTAGGPRLVPTVQAQVSAGGAPVGQGFVLDAGDLRFIYQQILVAQDHAAGGQLLGSGPNQVKDPQLPRGLRTVDGSFNNLVPIPDQHLFGAADQKFPRLLTPVFRPAEAGTSYAQTTGNVVDSQPRIISNLIVDQTAGNPAALAAASNPCGSGGFVCSTPASIEDVTDPDSGALFIPNITPDFGLSAPFNLMFTFFGQFFDHGLDLVPKSGSNVIMPLQPDDPLFVQPTAQNPNPPNFMVITRGTMLPGADGIVGTADDVHDSINITTPWVDQNQTYTSHPSHQVFLRQYEMSTGRPRPDGKVLDGGLCSPRGTGIPGDEICNIGNWAEVKLQAAQKLGIRLTDADVFNVPLILTDPYGHFKPGPNGFPQLVRPGNVLVEGNPAANGGQGITIPADALRTNHEFLADIAHNAVPSPGLQPDTDTIPNPIFTPIPAEGGIPRYDNELLDRHFITGDARGNENIALTMVHNLFHAEHNRLAHYIDQRLSQVLTADEVAAWHTVHAGSGWGYGERLFQAARFVTEMEYQHLVFEEFARTLQPLINPFLGGITSINGAITAEFAHTVYRLGHSMLPEVVGRINADGSDNSIRLLNAFLNPVEYNNGGSAGTLPANKAAGAIIRGLSGQIGNELDEFVTESVRNTLLGLPLDLPAVNLARGRSEGIPPLNEARRQFFNATHDSTVQPYENWFDFGLSLKHAESLVNFIAAYGTHASITSQSTVAGKRSAAAVLVATNDPFLFEAAATSGLNQVDFWIGGLAEKQAVFGGLLGSTFNFVFEKQLENLQDGDRFYYLQRTDGLNLKTQLEGNSFAELARRNTDVGATMDVIFNTADFSFDAATLTGTDPVDLGSGMSIFTTADGTKIFFDPLHTGKNIVFNGGPGVDRFRSDVGDDSIYGNGGNDRLDGAEGNDTMLGGDGNDVLFGQNGDDVLKGGPGADALNAGPGFGGDIVLGGEGPDFMVGGDDGDEYFGGGGNDLVIDGTMRSEGIFGGTGDDWLDAGDGHDGGLFGDEGNVFDLLAGLDFIGGDDVMDGGPGQDNHFGEGGDDVNLMSEGSNKYFGDFGFDWISHRGWPAPANIELDLLADPLLNLNFNDLRNLYRFVDGASGWDFNDKVRGSNNVLCDPASGEVAECLIPGMELTTAGAAKITGLPAMLGPAGFNVNLNDPAIPGIKNVGFMGGDILLGGRGSDILEGKQGDDVIDGDLWLNVQLEATMNDGTIKRVNGPRDLQDDVFSDPQRLNPANLRVIKEIVTPAVPAPDCSATAPVNCDVAVFSGAQAEYTIQRLLNGTVVVTHNAPATGGVRSDGTDRLRNVERLQFTDGIVDLTGAPAGTAVPNVAGLSQAAASAAITGAGLTVGTISSQNNNTLANGLALTTDPIAGVTVAPGSTVNLVMSRGPLVPDVHDLTVADAAVDLAVSGLHVGTVTEVFDAAMAVGLIVTQDPLPGGVVAPGGAVNVFVSKGPQPIVGLVPSVVGTTRDLATSSIEAASLVAGVTFANSATVAAGRVISQNPAAGNVLAAGATVNIVVSLGADGLVLELGFNEASGATVVDSSAWQRDGAVREAVRAAGKFGGALQFDGVNDWVTVQDTTNSPADLTNGMTIEAWVNPTTMSGWETVLMKERGNLNMSYALYAHDGAPLTGGVAAPAGYIRAQNGDQPVRGTSPLPLNTWTHVATTYDGANQRLFVNGVLVRTSPMVGNIAVANGVIRIGGNQSFSGEFFKGLIDEVRIYNRARTATQIQGDMNRPVVP